jgi:hypothetical protein
MMRSCCSPTRVHPTHVVRPVGSWAAKGENLAIEQTSGRDRINIHGAINLEASGPPKPSPYVDYDNTWLTGTTAWNAVRAMGWRPGARLAFFIRMTTWAEIT